MARTILFSLAFFTVAAFAAEEQRRLHVCQPWPVKKGTEKKQLCVDTFETHKGSGAEASTDIRNEWYWLSAQDQKSPAPVYEAGMSLIGDFRVSGDGKYLAVISGGEGVTQFDLFKVAPKIEKMPRKPVFEFSAWPGSVNFSDNYWRDNHFVVISDVLISDVKAHPKIDLKKPAEFRISPQGKVAQIPVRPT